MMTKIDGQYVTPSAAPEAVIIERTHNSEWQVLWAADENPLPMNALSCEYRVMVGDDWEGLGHFDGNTVSGYFPIEAFSEDVDMPEMLVLESEFETLPAIGTFQAKLRADGSFTVTIERWDGNLPPHLGHVGWFEPEMTRIETEWLRQQN